MIDSSKEFRQYVKAAAGEIRPPSDSRCPDEADLIAYQQGALPESKRESIQVHLMDCANCRETIVEAADFFQPVRPEERGVKDAASGKEWERVWTRFRGKPEHAWAFWRWPRPAFALAVSLAAAACLAGVWAISLERRLQATEQRNAQLIANLENVQKSVLAPRLNARVFDVYSRETLMRSSGARAVNRIRGPQQGTFTLLLNGEGQPRATSYSLEILDTSGELVWKGSGLTRDVNGNLSLSMNSEFLNEGEYRFRVLAGAAAAEYIILVEK